MDGKQKTEERDALRTAAESLDAPPQTPSDDVTPPDVDGAHALVSAESSSDAQADPASNPPPALQPEEIDRLTTDIVTALKSVYDPEIPADIYELGLIYKVEIDDDRNVAIDMTLTAPGCPVAGEMPVWVENAVNAVAGVAQTKVNLVFNPPWDQSRMSDEARLAVGMF